MPQPLPAWRLEGRTAVVVDDYPDAASAIARGLEMLGVDAHVFHDGPSAAVALQGFRPDILICDVMMPGFSGLDVLASLRRNEASRGLSPLRAIAFSAAPRLEAQALDAGFDAFLAKPVDLFDLTDALQKFWSAEPARSSAKGWSE